MACTSLWRRGLYVASHSDKKQAKSAHHKGAVGRVIAIDPWGNGTCVLIAKGSDLQDPELAHGLQPKTVAVECLRLSHPRLEDQMAWNHGCTEAVYIQMADHPYSRGEGSMA